MSAPAIVSVPASSMGDVAPVAPRAPWITNHTRIIDAPLEEVWALCADLTQIQEWNPNVESIDLITDATQGLGAKRRRHLVNGQGSLFETVTTYKDTSETEKSQIISVTEMKGPPFTWFEVSYGAVAKGEKQTEFTLSFRFVVKLGPLGALLGWLFLHSKIQKVTANQAAEIATRAVTKAKNTVQTKLV